MRAIGLLCVLIVAKICILAGRDIPLSFWTPIAYLWQDFLVVALFAALDFLLRKPKFAWALYAIIVLYSAVNVPVARVLSTPLTWPLLRATGVALSDSITYYVTWGNALLMLLIVAASIGFPFLFRNVRPRTVVITCAVLIIFAMLGPLAIGRIDTLGLHRNAIAAIAWTAFPNAPARSGSGDWRASLLSDAPVDDLSHYRGAAAGRNVILVSLESTAAQYLRPYGAKDDPMPNLTKLAEQAILFEDAYAVYPESIKGLFSVLCSTYPAIHTAPADYERVAIPSLAAVLAAAGYRTGLFHSGRFGYLGMESIIRNRSFQTLEDAGQISGNHNSSFGVDEPSTVKRILSWLDNLPRDQRFFIAYLPIAGHHPYQTPEQGPFPENDEMRCYLNALHYGDEALGVLVRGLQQRGLYENTLFVIYGDHGEAFGQHEGNFGHTLFVYDENVRVPYLIIAPGIVQKQVRVRRVASLIDTAPTILDLLGLPSPVRYQGRSLLESQPRMALFFTDYSLGLLGLRDREWKFIHELDSGRSKLFNVREDPGERQDLSQQFPDRATVYRQHLLRWCGYQRDLLHSEAPP